MWIQSKDKKTIIDAKCFQIEGNVIYAVNPEGTTSDTRFIELGKYEYQKEAFEALEKINKKIGCVFEL